MRQDEIGRIADAVYERFKQNAMGEITARFDALDKRLEGIENHLDRQDAEIGDVKGHVERISEDLDQRQGAV